MAPPGWIEWPSVDWRFDHQAVVGESFYQPAIWQAAGRDSKGEPVNRLVTAQLVAEHDNPHDKTAVAVLVCGEKVGHIPRDRAAELHRHLDAMPQPVTCRAVITGGKGHKTQVGIVVMLDVGLSPPDRTRGFLTSQGELLATPVRKADQELLASLEFETPYVVDLDIEDGCIAISLEGRRVGTIGPKPSERHLWYLEELLTDGSIRCACEGHVVPYKEGDDRRKMEIGLMRFLGID